MIFQDVMTSLNPLMKIGHQIMEPMMRHRGLTKAEAKKETIDAVPRYNLLISKRTSTPDRYPRAGGAIKKKPL